MRVLQGSHTLHSLESVRGDYGETRVGSDGTRSGWLGKG